MSDFLTGTGFALCCVLGLLFLRFWRKTGDRFFVFFAISFWLMALHRVVFLLLRDNKEYVGSTYLLRLLAYVLILVAIWEKNRVPSTRKAPPKNPGP